MWIGTNHYYWFTRILHRGRDLHNELRRRVSLSRETKGRMLSTALSQVYGHAIVYAEDSHTIEFYPFLTQLGAEKQRLPYGLEEPPESAAFNSSKPDLDPTRAATSVRDRLYRNYRSILDQTVLPPHAGDTLTGEGIAAILAAIAAGRRQVCILNMANRGAVPNLPLDAEIEVEALTDSAGARAVTMGAAPPVLKGFLEKRFVWHELVADAAVKGDRGLALQALLVDEMAIRPEIAGEMLDELLAASRELLPRFFGPGAERHS
jgi:alpha-galactosidase